MAAELTDTQRRFLAAVVERVSRERVREIYLFSPLKQGGVETGVAVIAAADDVPPPGPGDGALRAAEESDPTEAAAREDADVDEALPLADACVVVGENVAAALEAGETEDAIEALAVERPADALDADALDADAPDADALDADALDADAQDADAPDDAVDRDEPRDDDATGGDATDGTPLHAPSPDVAPQAPPPSRFTILTARYRLQLKGPDRGRWEVDVVEEADAPLVTVDAVVRGVQRRAGELSAVERLSAADLDAALDEAPWARR
ncbi:MAG TPA: hypothetical protein VGE02_07215 [Gemmatimonadales bacterium]